VRRKRSKNYIKNKTVKPQRVKRKQIKNDPQVTIIVNRWIATTPSACYTRSLSHYSAYQIWH